MSSDEVEVVRSEERLVASVVREPVEKVRVHRDVVVDRVTRTFDVRREVLRIEREPVARGEDAAVAVGRRDAPEVIEVVLREERPVVTVDVVPVERVRVSVTTSTGVVRLTDDVRVERVGLDTAAAPDG